MMKRVKIMIIKMMRRMRIITWKVFVFSQRINHPVKFNTRLEYHVSTNLRKIGSCHMDKLAKN